MTKHINLFVKPEGASVAAEERVEQFFTRRGYAISHMYQKDALYNVVIGGDGTFLRAVHTTEFSDIPFIGINTGTLGFFQEISRDDIEEHLTLLLEGKVTLDSLAFLDASITTNAWTYTLHALNEFVIQSNDHRILHLHVSIDDVPFINTSGDGLIVSTPAGSTAYNLSAGGAMLHQTLEGYQLTAVNPIRSKSYDALPSSMVLPATSTTAIAAPESDRERMVLIGDGIVHRFCDIDEVRFQIAPRAIRRVVFKPNWYWRNLREKLI